MSVYEMYMFGYIYLDIYMVETCASKTPGGLYSIKRRGGRRRKKGLNSDHRIEQKEVTTLAQDLVMLSKQRRKLRRKYKKTKLYFEAGGL